MIEISPKMQIALQLMDQALNILDEIDAYEVAMHLQNTLDIAWKSPIPRNESEAAELLATPAAMELLAKILSCRSKVEQ